MVYTVYVITSIFIENIQYLYMNILKYIYIYIIFIIKNHVVVAGAKGLVKRVFPLTNAWKAKEYEPPRCSKSFGKL